MEILLYYVRDKGPAAHIWDYVEDQNDRALCGHRYTSPIDLGEVPRPRRVCRKCQSLAPKAEAILWREAANQANKEIALWYRDYENLRTEYNDLVEEYEKLRAAYARTHEHAENQRKELNKLHRGRSNRRLPPENRARKPKKSNRDTKPFVNLSRDPSGKRPRVRLLG